MNTINKIILLIAILIIAIFTSCSNKPTEVKDLNTSTYNQLSNQKAFVATLTKHLNAVSTKDAATLKGTMAPTGKMQLILPGTEIINTVDSFMNYHTAWFRDTTTTWTFETKILNTEVGEQYGIGITEILYKEPLRNGEPYFNRMTVSYALEKINGQWYIIKDHASSIEKSTDKK